MPEKLTPETRAEIVNLRKQGKSFVQIEDELKIKRGALSHIGNRAWFVAAMKEKGEDGKTGYRLFSEARKARLKEALKRMRKVKPDAKKEKKKKEKKKEPLKESGIDSSPKSAIEAEVESHLQGSDKDPRRVKQKKGELPGAGQGKVEKEKGKKGKGALLIVLILIIAAAVIIAFFMVFGRKEKGKEPGEEAGKEEETKKEFDGRPFENL